MKNKIIRFSYKIIFILFQAGGFYGSTYVSKFLTTTNMFSYSSINCIVPLLTIYITSEILKRVEPYLDKYFPFNENDDKIKVEIEMELEVNNLKELNKKSLTQINNFIELNKKNCNKIKIKLLKKDK